MDKQAELDKLYEEYSRIAVLQEVAGGKRLVRGHGPLDAPVVVVGEAPGQREDEQGIPFVGASGQVLRGLLRDAGIPWEFCYVMNVLPWRPASNRTPYLFEVQASYDRVEQEITLIYPARVICAGATAWDCVSRRELGRFSEARGHWHQMPLRDYLTLPVFHPSYVMRHHGEKRAAIEADLIRSVAEALEATGAA